MPKRNGAVELHLRFDGGITEHSAGQLSKVTASQVINAPAQLNRSKSPRITCMLQTPFVYDLSNQALKAAPASR